MNARQKGYRIASKLQEYFCIVAFGVSMATGYRAIQCASTTHDNPIDKVRTITYGTICAITGYGGLRLAATKGKLWYDIHTANKDKNAHPFEHVERVVIEDTAGLERVLAKTDKNETKEWGTFLRARTQGTDAVIYEVMSEEEVERAGIIQCQTAKSLTFNFKRAVEHGVNGGHHYHPRPKDNMELPFHHGTNMCINWNDRSCGDNWINLLTFNTPEGPEIIAFNKQHTYISKKEDKRVLEKATSEEILEHLGA